MMTCKTVGLRRPCFMYDALSQENKDGLLKLSRDIPVYGYYIADYPFTIHRDLAKPIFEKMGTEDVMPYLQSLPTMDDRDDGCRIVAICSYVGLDARNRDWDQEANKLTGVEKRRQKDDRVGVACIAFSRFGGIIRISITSGCSYCDSPGEGGLLGVCKTCKLVSWCSKACAQKHRTGDCAEKAVWLKAIEPTIRQYRRMCGRCGAMAAWMPSCVACHRVYYCTRECQKKDWKERHKQECERLQKADNYDGHVV